MVTWVRRIYGLFPLPETAFAPHRWSTFIPHEGHILAPYSWGTFAYHSWDTDIALFTDYWNSLNARYNKPLQRLVCPCECNESGIDTNCWIIKRKRAIEPLPNVFTAAIAQVRRLLSTIGVPIKCINPIFLFYTKIKKYGLTHFLKIVPSNWRK